MMVVMLLDHGSGHLAVGSAGKSLDRKNTIASGMRKTRMMTLKRTRRTRRIIVGSLSELRDWKRGTRAITEVYEAQMSLAERSLPPVNSFMLI